MDQVFRTGVSIFAAAMMAASAGAATLNVAAGGDLQGALNAARPGDTILVQAGATFTGNFVLPAKGGGADITVRSSTADAALPAAGQRMTPAYAALLPKIRSNSNGPALSTAVGATHWRLLFLEFYPAPGTSTSTLVALGTTGTAQSTLASVPRFFTVDRSYFHGDATAGQRRGIALNSGDTSVVNSYFADFKGMNQDTQAICGWNGPGPFLVENNYLEAAGENIMFGGSDPNIPGMVPTGIVIRRNHITRPMAWRTQGWVVKNLVELKNAHDVLVEGNLIENHWVGAQPGSSIVITPRNQSGTAPWSGIKHVVIQNNVIRHVSSGFNILGWDNLASSQQTDDILIRNNLLYDVSSVYAAGSVAGPARLLLIGAGPKSVRLDHNTIDSNGSSTVYFYAGATSNGVTTIDGFELTNNLMRSNSYALYGDAVGEGVKALARFAPTGIVLRNAIAGANPKFYPTGNDFPATAQWLADFVNVAQADYRLTASALSRRTGTDGKDLGVDFVELDAAMNAVAPTALPPFIVSIPASPAGQVGVPYQLAAAVSGTLGSVAWSVTSGALPAGLTLDPSAGVISGMPTSWGTTTAVVQARDSWSVDRTDAKPLTIVVAPAALQITTNVLGAGEYQQTYQSQLATSGGSGRTTFAVIGGALPPGLTLDPSGMLSGVPTAIGTFTLTVRAVDANSPDSHADANLVLVVTAPVLRAAVSAPASAQVGVGYQGSGTVTGLMGTAAWTVTAGGLPPGIALNGATGAFAGVPTAYGVFTATIQVQDSYSPSRVVGSAVTIAVAPTSLVITTLALPVAHFGSAYAGTLAAAGGTGAVTWSLDSGALPAGIILSPGGALTGSSVALGTFTFSAKATDAGWPGNAASRALTLSVTAGEVVLYAADATSVNGTWSRVADPTSAGGARMWNPDRAAAKLATAMVAPANYFEMTFNAQAGVPYHLWMRGKADKNSWANDSVYVQFSGSVDAGGTPIYRVGTTSATVYSVENGSNAGLAGWGWNDGAYTGLAAPLYFAATGPQTIRVQVREDGLSIDQIVLSSGTYLTASPGAFTNDTAILLK